MAAAAAAAATPEVISPRRVIPQFRTFNGPCDDETTKAFLQHSRFKRTGEMETGGASVKICIQDGRFSHGPFRRASASECNSYLRQPIKLLVTSEVHTGTSE